MTLWLILTPLLPLAAAVLVVLLQPKWSGYIAAAGLAGSLACLLVLGPETLTAGGTWMSSGALTLTVSLYLDGLSWWMGVLVASICLLVLIYSISYIEDRPRHFFALMSFFGASMLALVLAGSFPLLFAAWEGVGAASFMLIAHHHRGDEAREAARKAFLMTRLGDVGLLIGWLLVWVTLEISAIQPFLTMVEEGRFAPDILLLLAFLFLAAAVGKSAQLPLSAWLPDAMAGPTPVSALLHSATMVAAGVYLLLRLFPLYETLALPDDIILWIGGVTAVVGALIATMEFDLKRILAWSTVSQLGEMMIALGLFAPVAAAFHLTTHAVFKSGLFLAAGAVERATGTRDLRELGGQVARLPWTAGVFVACSLALAAFPPFAGFWSEEKILGAAIARDGLWGGWMIGLVALAGVYIGRAAFAVFGREQTRGSEIREGEQTGGSDQIRRGEQSDQIRRGEQEPGSDQVRRGEGTTGSQLTQKHPVPAFSMLLPMVLLAAGAAGIGYALRIPVGNVLPFAAPSHDLGLWRWAAVAASVFGLAFGALRGSAPAFGRMPAAWVAVVNAVPKAGAGLVSLFARIIGGADRGIDVGSKGAASLTQRIARGMGGTEWVLDRGSAGVARLIRGVARGFRYPERAFDAAARGSAWATLAFSRGTESIERAGFGRGIDRAAYGIQSRGGDLSRLETGKIYRYTLSLFVWVIVAAAVVIVLML